MLWHIAKALAAVVALTQLQACAEVADAVATAREGVVRVCDAVAGEPRPSESSSSNPESISPDSTLVLEQQLTSQPC